MSRARIVPDDCLEVFAALEPDSLDAVITDPPGGIAFMGRAWDKALGGRDAWIAYWAARLKVALAATKPGGWLLCWAMPRTCGWTQMAIENAGWFVVDTMHHAFGTGWPKGQAQLKPSHEVWFLARKPGGTAVLQIDSARVPRGGNEHHRETVKPHAQNGLWKVGSGDNGGGFEPTNSTLGSWPANSVFSHCHECQPAGMRRVNGANNSGKCGPSGGTTKGAMAGPSTVLGYASPDGTEVTPAHLCLAGCPACYASTLAPQGGPAPVCESCGRPMVWACPVAELDAQSGNRPGFAGGVLRRGATTGKGVGYGSSATPEAVTLAGYGGEGGASRFFHCLPGDVLRYEAKASGAERHAGCEELYWRRNDKNPFGFDRVTREEWETAQQRARFNVHPTVKPLAFMRHVVSLLVPRGGKVGDLCTGSGGTAIACEQLGVEFVGAEFCPEAVEIAEARLAWWRARTAAQTSLLGGEELILPEPVKPARKGRDPERMGVTAGKDNNKRHTPANAYAPKREAAKEARGVGDASAEDDEEGRPP